MAVMSELIIPEAACQEGDAELRSLRRMGITNVVPDILRVATPLIVAAELDRLAAELDRLAEAYWNRNLVSVADLRHWLRDRAAELRVRRAHGFLLPAHGREGRAVTSVDQLHAMGVPAELEKAINEAWNVVIPTDVTDEEYWRLSIAKDERLVELYTQLHDALTCAGLMTKLVLDARNGRRDQIREARRAIEAGKRRSLHGSVPQGTTERPRSAAEVQS